MPWYESVYILHHQVALIDVQSAVKKILIGSGVNPDSIEGLANIFDSRGPFGRLFPNLDTVYMQMKFCKTYLKYVVSCYAPACLKQLYSLIFFRSL